jgi:hypothetical protein
MNGQINRDVYTVEEVANHFKRFMFDRHYQNAFAQIVDQHKPMIGFMIAGYSSGQPRGEVWDLIMDKGVCLGPNLSCGQDLSEFRWEGQPVPLRRLILGFDPVGLAAVLQAEGVEAGKIGEIIQQCRAVFGCSMIDDTMPIQDAIDLAVFLEQTSAGFSRFCEGPTGIGGPVEVAVMTKYEGFKWVKRKHFFNKKLN